MVGMSKWEYARRRFADAQAEQFFANAEVKELTRRLRLAEQRVENADIDYNMTKDMLVKIQRDRIVGQ